MAYDLFASEWDSNASIDKTCKDLFPKREVGRNVKGLALKNQITIKSKKKGMAKKDTNKGKSDSSLQKVKQPGIKAIKMKDEGRNSVKQRQNVEYLKTPSVNRTTSEQIKEVHNTPKQVNKPNSKGTKIKHVPERHGFAASRKEKSKMSLRERMMEKLKGARFRYLNEQMYTNPGHDSKKYFDINPGDYKAYHDGYRQQVSRWPVNPVDVIIAKIKQLPKNYVIADFGCGEAKLAKSVPQKVHSFDLVAVDESVTACDMCNVPLANSSVDVVVFCLSLMGTNLKEYLREAIRVLKIGGILKIAEVESRFDSVDTFIENVVKYGFKKSTKDMSHEMFWFLDFIKKDSKQQHKLPDIHLNPCLYKRR